MKLTTLFIFFFILQISLAFASTLKSFEISRCLSSEVSKDVGESYKRLFKDKCLDVQKELSSIVVFVNDLESMKPISEEKLIEKFGKDWREKFKAVSSQFLEISKVFSTRYEVIGLKNAFEKIPFTKEFVDSTRDAFLKNVDLAFAGVTRDNIKAKNFREINSDQAGMHFILRRVEANEDSVPQFAYLSSWSNCTHSEKFPLLPGKKTACEKSERLKPKYLQLNDGNDPSDIKDAKPGAT